MPFYHFRQNNSGGRFVINDKLNKNVFIEASSPQEANSIAKDLGIYFNGVNKGSDCECCGDRWYEVDEYDAVEKVKFDKWTLPKETIIHHSKLTPAPTTYSEYRRLEI